MPAVIIHLRNTGDAPLLAAPDILIDASRPALVISEHIRRTLKEPQGTPIVSAHSSAPRRRHSRPCRAAARRSSLPPLAPCPAQFIYLKNAFTPSPDELVGVLADAFGRVNARGQRELIVNYALQQAWG